MSGIFVHLEGGGCVWRLMERSFLNFHFDYWNPSLIRFQFYGDFNFLNAINECIQHSIVPHQVDFDCTTSRFGRVIKTLWSFLPLKKSQQCHRTFIIYSNYYFNWSTPGKCFLIPCALLQKIRDKSIRSHGIPSTYLLTPSNSLKTPFDPLGLPKQTPWTHWILKITCSAYGTYKTSPMTPCRGDICDCWQQCNFFASGVNFSRKQH